MSRTATILVVDDNAVYSRLIADILSEAGYHVQIAEDGPTALRMIAAALPALVVLDLMLPGMSGRDVLARLRGPGIPNLPVIIISANPAAHELLSQGANAVLIKPLAFDELLACVTAHTVAE
jgi:two-component system, sensor histidine kinase and response regulator